MDKKIENEVIQRNDGKCEICQSDQDVSVQIVENMPDGESDSYVALCQNCNEAIQENLPIEGNQWRVLTESMWSEVPSVKVLSWRLLNSSDESWADEALEMLYIDDDLLEMAKSNQEEATHFDSNGNPLYKGDNVTLIKDLDVKGSSLVAKRGTAVRNISLDRNDPTHIIGKVDGQTIYIKTEFVKK